MKKLAHWIATRPWIIAAFGSGLGLGLLLMLPLGFTVSDGVAQVMASVVTTFLAIGGAVLLWQVQEARKEDQLAAAISTSFILLTHAVNSLIKDLTEAVELDPIPSKKIHSSAAALILEITETKERLARHHSVQHALSALRLLAVINLETQLQTLNSRASIVQMRTDGTQVPGGARQSLLGDLAELRSQSESIAEDLGVLDDGFDDPERFLVSQDRLRRGRVKQ